MKKRSVGIERRREKRRLAAQVSFRLLRCLVTVTSIRLLHDNQSAHFRANSFSFFYLKKMIVTIQTGKVKKKKKNIRMKRDATMKIDPLFIIIL